MILCLQPSCYKWCGQGGCFPSLSLSALGDKTDPKHVRQQLAACYMPNVSHLGQLIVLFHSWVIFWRSVLCAHFLHLELLLVWWWVMDSRPHQILHCFVADMSSTAFIEPKTVMEFIHDLLNKDLSRGLTNSDLLKVWPSSLCCLLVLPLCFGLTPG